MLDKKVKTKNIVSIEYNYNFSNINHIFSLSVHFLGQYMITEKESTLDHYKSSNRNEIYGRKINMEIEPARFLSLQCRVRDDFSKIRWKSRSDCCETTPVALDVNVYFVQHKETRCGDIRYRKLLGEMFNSTTPAHICTFLFILARSYVL